MPDDSSQKSSPVTLEEYDAMGRDAKVAVWLQGAYGHGISA